MAARSLRGCLTALVTPFKSGAIDFAAFDRLIDRQLENGIAGLVLCGTTGESPTLSDAEQRDLVDRAVRRVKAACPVVAGTGTNNTRHTLEMSKQACDVGADALMLVAPYYNKPSQEGLYQHFAMVAHEIALPIVLYNIPGRCGVEIHHDTIRRLESDCPDIVAVKHATGSVNGACQLKADSRLTLLSGDDPLTLALIHAGAEGAISVLSNLLPNQMATFVRVACEGDHASARQLHEAMLPLAEALLSLDTNPVPIKAAMALSGLIEEEYRLPLCPIHRTGRDEIVRLLSPFGLG
jgi:4-hydroxy-tetrahydrodipicolinate synthase